ncbi:glycosyltransferase family 2 protein [Noviherbaspirillum saxi]|nr:glycosyltransferase [Noviherbaspirillum saxi]
MTKIIAFNKHRKVIAADHSALTAQAGVVMRRRNTSAATPIGLGTHHAGRAVAIAASIVVPTRGRPQLLNRCLASLALQSFDSERFEIIVVDDGPSEQTRDVVSGWAAHSGEKGGPLVTYIPSMGPHGPAAARNHGWRAARGAIVAFTDDDTIARADWLRNGIQAFADDVHAVCGRVIMPLEGTPTDYELDAKNLETAEFVTANCFCRRKVLEDLGGFDEQFRFAWREDSDLHFRLLDYHANIVREPNAVMMHPVRPAGWGVSLRQVKKVQFDALLYKKHPKLYRRKIRARPRWDFYLTVVALTTMLLSLLGGAAGLGVLSGLIWIFMTGRFCFQRLQKTSKAPGHILEMVVTSMLIPPMAVFWRAVGAVRYKVGFL